MTQDLKAAVELEERLRKSVLYDAKFNSYEFRKVVSEFLTLRAAVESQAKRVDELEAYKRRIDMAVRVSETCISDELIRRKQAEVLRWAADSAGLVCNWRDYLNRTADKVERGEIEIGGEG